MENQEPVNAASSDALDVSVEAKAGLERAVTVRVPSQEIEQQITLRLNECFSAGDTVVQTDRQIGDAPGRHCGWPVAR